MPRDDWQRRCHRTRTSRCTPCTRVKLLSSLWWCIAKWPPDSIEWVTFLARCLRVRDCAAQFSMSIRMCGARLLQHSVPCPSVFARRLSDRHAARSECKRRVLLHDNCLAVDALGVYYTYVHYLIRACNAHAWGILDALLACRRDAHARRPTPAASTVWVWLYHRRDFLSFPCSGRRLDAAMRISPWTRLASALSVNGIALPLERG